MTTEAMGSKAAIRVLEIAFLLELKTGWPRFRQPFAEGRSERRERNWREVTRKWLLEGG